MDTRQGVAASRAEQGGGCRVSAERYARAKAIFLDACERPQEDRARFLDGACGGDADLREEVESLLAHHTTEAHTAPAEASTRPYPDDRETREHADAQSGSVRDEERILGTMLAGRYEVHHEL